MRASKGERYVEKKKVWRRREDSLQGILDRESVLEPWTVGPSEDRGPLKRDIRVSEAKDESHRVALRFKVGEMKTNQQRPLRERRTSQVRAVSQRRGSIS